MASTTNKASPNQEKSMISVREWLVRWRGAGTGEMFQTAKHAESTNLRVLGVFRDFK